MKNQLTKKKLSIVLLAVLLPAFGLVACDNRLEISPTVPTFTSVSVNVGALRTLDIHGTLLAENGSCVRATILFDGVEINGARSKCPEAAGCTRLDLHGTVSAFAGEHVITFQVLRQRQSLEDYLATGEVEITGIDLGSLDPVRLELPPTHGTLSEGQGLTFELELQD